MTTHQANESYTELGEASGVEALSTTTSDDEHHAEPEISIDPWAALINPLVDAPPRPPPIPSYQHSFSIDLGDSHSDEEDSRQLSSGSNYFYTSAQLSDLESSDSSIYPSPGIKYELASQRNRQKRSSRCQVCLLLTVVAIVAWRSVFPTQEAAPNTMSGLQSIQSGGGLRNTFSMAEQALEHDPNEQQLSMSLTDGTAMLDKLEASVMTPSENTTEDGD